MSIQTKIKPSQYYDSITLMLAARELAQLPGINDAAVVMATEANKSLLKNAGLLSAEAEAATPNDLVIAVSGTDEAGEQALAAVEKLLQKKTGADAAGQPGAARPLTLPAAVKAAPGSNLAVISVAGRYAAAEAWDALHQGLHVLLFSDNVSLEAEIALKRYAVAHGLLLMGPGAGTAILNGVALGFANVVPAGPVGIVSAAGTGLQEVSSLLARQGIGLTQGIGTGGRDLRLEVGGLMMLAGLQALQADPATQVIVLISKPPAVEVDDKVLEQVAQSEKPTVICFLGGRQTSSPAPHVYRVQTLEQAAQQAAALVSAPEAEKTLAHPPIPQPFREVSGGRRATGCLRGLFSGGTLCYEAQVIWRDLLPEPVFSNAPLEQANTLPDSTRSQGHTAVDLGEEEFTVGRPHPMIDNDLRIRRILQEAQDPETAVIVLDVVLGYGAHPDPAAELAPAIEKAHEIARQAERGLQVVASVTGTPGDPQGLADQIQRLQAAGATICPSNAAAARLAGRIVNHEA